MHRRLPCRPAGRIALALSLLGFALQTSTLAGPLEPPPGPVAPTHKTLTEVEPRTPISSLPFIINEPGSYYVTGNLTSVDGLGIVINAPNVTLDLMGHTLTGGEGSSAAVASTALGVNPTVKNGRVTGWGTAAISVTGAHLFDLEAVDNRSAGFSIGSDSVVSRCTARSNGGHGFVGSVRNTIESCTSHDNDGHGFSLSTSSSIRFCTATTNASSGFEVGSSSTIRFCTATANASNGFDTSISCTLHDCTSSANTLDGFNTSSGCRLERCVASRNGRHGITVGTRSSVLNCTAAEQSAGSGILVTSNGAVVQGCFAWGNVNGIDATGNSARIEGNTAQSNTRGFNVAGTSNLIIRNAADNNSANYFIVANNVVGATVQAPLSGAIAGSTGGAGVGTTNPWANFSY